VDDDPRVTGFAYDPPSESDRHWRPRNSLLWQVLLVTVIAIAISQVAVVYLTRTLVDGPRAYRSVNYFINHLQTIGAALDLLEPDQEEAFMKRVAERESLFISHAQGSAPPPGLRPAPDRNAMKLFRERVRETFGRDSEIYVQRGDENAAQRTLWVMLPLEKDEDYWVGFPQVRISPARTLATSLWIMAGLAAALGASIFLFLRFNRPLRQIANAAREVGKGRGPPPLPETGPAEIGAVARAFNCMNDRLQQGDRDRATFLEGVSHGLCTPLDHLKLALETQGQRLEPETRDAMSSDLKDMSSVVQQFIEFAHGETDERLDRVDLSKLANECAERAARSGVQVRCDLGRMPLMQLRPMAMQRLVGNLLENAARHAGGEIEIRTFTQGKHAHLWVLDRGPGIPLSQVQHLKAPFTRGDVAHSGAPGAGLGLAIAERIARLHSGLLYLFPREGGGLEARVTLPLR
jgi:two-component system osmolarity sensor histidine kinase EnvZ